jgi:hypothetical protein
MLATVAGKLGGFGLGKRAKIPVSGGSSLLLGQSLSAP